MFRLPQKASNDTVRNVFLTNVGRRNVVRRKRYTQTRCSLSVVEESFSGWRNLKPFTRKQIGGQEAYSVDGPGPYPDGFPHSHIKEPLRERERRGELKHDRDRNRPDETAPRTDHPDTS
ncbi:unnamed protein product [Boreogadus saida]